ncbi:MAG TPA: response regulator transcription factor [Solirubrobacterales bacterium]|nr:response regulator transcription factor [Solirubrobacterales bacterium]
MATAPASSPSIDVLVLDRHDVGRIGLALILKRADGIGRCLVAADPAEGMALARGIQPDVIVLSASDLGPLVAPLAGALRAAAPGVRLLLRSRCGEIPPQTLSAARAEGVIPGGADAEETVAIVLAAASSEGRPQPQADAGLLTERERAVLRLVATGATNREIAAAIHVGPDMVKKNVGSILRKLGARNRTEASRLAREALLV